MRFARALARAGLTVHVIYHEGTPKDKGIYFHKAESSIFSRLGKRAWNVVNRLSSRYLNTNISLNIVGSSSINVLLDTIRPDIVNIHWVHAEWYSIKSISKLDYNTFITLHDMWWVNGKYHYLFGNRRCALTGWRLNKVYNKENFHFITPSSWLTGEMNDALPSDKQAITLHNALDDEIWRPVDLDFDRANKHIITFGAFGASSLYRKGADLLRASLLHLQKHRKLKDVEIHIIGSSDNFSKLMSSELECSVVVYGRITDERKIREILQRSSVLALPSRLDNFPNMACESIAVNTPVVSFRCGGIDSIISHGVNGLLVTPFDIVEFGNALMLERKYYGDNLRTGLIDKIKYSKIADKFLETAAEKFDDKN